MSLLTVKNLKKSFRSDLLRTKKEVLKDVSFEIQEGDLFGFLGHNGAGKTTTIKIILDLIRKDAGEVIYAGRPLASASQREAFGYLPELPYFYDHLTIQETIDYLSALALPSEKSAVVKKRAEQSLELVGLTDRRAHKVKSLSKGLQQRLGLAQAIVNKPKLLLLDEPFSGLDPSGRAEFRTIIQDLNSSGTTILISSHILSDVQELCNRVSIMVQGEIKRSFALEERGALFGEKRILRLQVQKETAIPEQLRLLPESIQSSSTHLGEQHLLVFADTKKATSGISIALELERSGACTVLEYRSEARTLEDIFLEITASK